MPYTHRKVGNKYVVYKNGKKVGSTDGTKTALNKYLAALHIADKPKKESIKENMMGQDLGMEPSQFDHPGCEDSIGKIFVVLKPTPETSPVDLVHPTHAFGMGQFNPQGVHGIYNDEEEANIVAEAAQANLHKQLAELESKKDHVLDEISKRIDKLQREINSHMKEATQIPEMSERHHQLAEKKMNVIKGLRDKHRIVKASRKELPKKDEE
jgi:hypothetical protein